MLQTIPENKYKSVEIGKNITVTGHKSIFYTHNNGLNSLPDLDIDKISLNIETNYDRASNFKFIIDGRENILKLKEAVDFALKIDEENKND